MKFHHSIRDRSVYDLIVNRFVIVYLCLLAAGFAIHFNTEANFTVPESWVENITRNCGIEDKMIIDPERANFQKLFLSASIIGLYLGVIVDQKYLESHKYPYFYETDFLTSVKRMVVCTVVGCPLLLPMVLVSKKNPFWIVIIFKTWLPPTLASFYLFGFAKTVAVYFGLANTTKKYKYKDEIYEYMHM